MLDQLAKLAAASAALRNATFEKKAVLLGAVNFAAKTLGTAGKVALKHPVAALSTAAIGMGAKGEAKKNIQGFRPENHAAMAGMAPVPPGVG